MLKRYPLAVSAFLLLAALLVWLPGVEFTSSCFSIFAGESLLSGIRHNHLLWSMPLQLLLVSLIKLHFPFAAAVIFVQLMMACVLVLVFVLALQFGNSLSAAAVVLVFALSKQALGNILIVDPEQLLYVIVILTVALALVLREDGFSYRGMWKVAALIGVGMMVRSPLFMFPVLLLLYDFWRTRRPGGSGIAFGQTFNAAHIIFLVLPFLMLLPRTWMLWKTYGSPVFFEVGRAENAIVTSALGVVSAVDHGRALAGIGHGESIWLWFVGQVAGHPLRFLGGMAKRLYFTFSMTPILFVAAGAALLRFRKSEALRMPAMLSIYLIVFYAFFCVEARYLLPVYALLLAMSAALFSGERGPALPSTPTAFRRIGVWTLRVMVGVLFAAYVVVSLLLLAYHPRAVQYELAPYAVAAHYPDNSWMQHQTSILAVKQGKLEVARKLAGKALLSSSGRPEFLRQYLLALVLNGTNIDRELGKFRYSDATGILVEADEAPFAWPKLLNSCFFSPADSGRVLSSQLLLDRSAETQHLEYSGLGDDRLLNVRHMNDASLSVLLVEIMGEFPAAKKCFAAQCLLGAVQQSGDTADLTPLQKYADEVCAGSHSVSGVKLGQ